MKSNLRNSFLYQMSKSDITKIIVFCSLFFVILHFIRIVFLISGQGESFFMDTFWKGITLRHSWQVQLKQFWSLLSYMFIDMSFMQLLGNMIWLWIFGSVIEDLHGKYKVIPLYLISGLVGGASLVTYSTFSGNQQLDTYAGTLAPIVGIMAAVLSYKPKYNFYFTESFKLPIWVLAIIFVILNGVTMSLVNTSFLALLLSVAVVGVLYNYGLNGFFNTISRFFKRSNTYFWNNENFKVPSQRKETYNMDDLLDKINEKGIKSLSKNEKEWLEKYNSL